MKIRLLTIILASSLFSCSQNEKADLLIYNAIIYTVDSSFSTTEAIAIKNGKILEAGKTKDLENAKIIDRTGGLLGIGRTSKLSADFDESQFTQVDFTQMGAIPVDSRNVKIITSHPSDSYSLTKDKKDVVKCIVIIDPEKFWANSKYLVVVKE